MEKTIVNQSKTNALRPFVHLHTHTEYSLLDGIAKINELVEKAIEDGMPGMAITDHANMFGVCEFVECVNRKNAKKSTNFKPIIGCEVYVARRGMEHKSDREDFAGYHLVLLAKNYMGYQNLVRIVSNAHINGFYGRPRTDKADLERYHEGLICTSACIGGEVAQHILNDRLAEAEETARWYKNLFGDDFYLELHRHRAAVERANHDIFELEERVNRGLLAISKRLGIKVICANDIHFVNEEDAEAQDTFLCLTWNKKYDDPDRLVFSKQEWMKTTAEMNALFADIPEALNNTVEILNKVEHYSIAHAPLLPQPSLPEGIDEVEHLARLTFEGAYKRFGERLPDEVKVRIKDELRVINHHGYPAYFLMWHEIISAAHELGAQIGPGRSSVCGSMVAYCLGITQIDPLRYGLLFERFINPKHRCLPDIDLDLDEYGREQVLEWMKQRYGEEHIAHIVSFYKALNKPAPQRVASVYNEGVESMSEATKAIAERLKSVTSKTHIHSCGIALHRDKMRDFIPMALVENQYRERVVATQYDGSYIEDMGAIKLDLLSLNHLAVIKRTLEDIRLVKGVEVDMDHLALDDEKTLNLFRRGETVGVFCFDSVELQKCLCELQPDRFEEIVALYTLYRPGPMDFIPEYIEGKKRTEPIEYEIPAIAKYLDETYGVILYQEQIMLIAQELASFSTAESDDLRKALGLNWLAKESVYTKFIKQGVANGLNDKALHRLWEKMVCEKAFNKSHAVAYALLAYQTAYLKAHYPTEYMEALCYCYRHNHHKHERYLEEISRLGVKQIK